MTATGEYVSTLTPRGPLLEVPLQSFDIPPAANSALMEDGLTQLILQCVIDPDEYRGLLSPSTAPTVPALSPALHTLCLSSFGWGYPPGFLTALRQQLRDVKNITLSRQLFTGTSEESRRDAESFLYTIDDLVDLYLYDVLMEPGFLAGLAEQLKKPGKEGLMTLVAYYTNTESLPPKAPISELHLLITPGIMRLELTEPKGIAPFPDNTTDPLVMTLTSPATAPRALKLLKCTLYQFTMQQLKAVLSQHQQLFRLHVTLRLESTESRHVEELWDILALCQTLKEVEVVWFPSMQTYREIGESQDKDQTLRGFLPDSERLKVLSTLCPDLVNFDINVLRTPSLGYATWKKEGGEWRGQVHTGQAQQD